MARKDAEYSNEVEPDEELKRPTAREQSLSELAEKAKDVKPALYSITSKNPKALRVVHDFRGRPISIQPGQTRHGVLLAPNIASYLGNGDLELTASAPSPQSAA